MRAVTHHCTVPVLPNIMSRVRLGTIGERRTMFSYFCDQDEKEVKSDASEAAWNVCRAC